MEKAYRFVCAHRRGISSLGGLLIGCVLAALGLFFDAPFLPLVLLAFVLVTILSVGIGQCSSRLLVSASKMLLDRCDPYPYQEELRTQLSYGYGLQLDTLLRVDFAMTLHHTGAHETAMNVMKNIPIDKKKAAQPVIQAIYYNNLAAFLTHAGDYAGAEPAWERFRELADGKARAPMTRHYAATRILAEAHHLYRIGEVRTALEKARTATEKTAMDRVTHAWFRAKCAIALEDQDTARRELNYVIAHGNKLAMVQDAWAMLKKLDLED